MLRETQELCLRYITEEWRKLSWKDWPKGVTLPRPWGVWIAEYPAIPPEARDIEERTQLAYKTWFLSDRGLKARNPWEFARFLVVNCYHPWYTTSGPQKTIWGTPHEIGLAQFAPYAESESIYLATTWAVLYGQGYRMRVVAGALQIEETLWKS